MARIFGVEPAGSANIAEERRAPAAQHVEHRLALSVSCLPDRRPRERLPGVGVLAEEERDRRPGSQLRGFGELGRSRRQARPADFAGQAEHVEHRRVVAVEAGRKHRALPGRSGKLEAVELRERPRAGRRGRSADRRIDVLPAEEEAHEVRRADRLDLGAEPVQRVAMDAREQRPIAPFERPMAGR